MTAGKLVFGDHATQIFEVDGGTTHFGSFWPPSYRASYDLHWIVEDGTIVALRFTELGRSSRFDGRYRE